MNPPVFVVDTNVIVAGLLTVDSVSPPAKIVDSMLSGSMLFLLSPELLAEYRQVLARPRIAGRHGLSAQDVDRVLVDLAANAIWRDPGPGPRAPDRGDDHLVALARSHAGSFLVTGDRLLQDAAPAGMAVISPRGWVEAFTD